MAVDLPLSLQMQLTQEAYLQVSIARLKQAQESVGAELAQLEKQKGNLVSRTEPAVKAALLEKNEQATFLADGVRYAELTLQELRGKLETALEDFLRMASADYQKGMRGHRFFGDLVRAIERLDQRLSNLRRHIGEARNCLAGGWDAQHQTYRDHARAAIESAAYSGSELEEDIAFFNQLAEAHADTVDETSFATVQLPRFNDFPYKTFIEDQLKVSAHLAQTRFDTMLDECDELHRHGLVKLREGVEAAKSQHQQAGDSFVLNYWQILRDYAQANWVIDDQLSLFMQSLESGMQAAKKKANGRKK